MVQVGQQQIVTNNKTGDSENWNMLKSSTRRFSSPNDTVSQDGTGNFRTIMEAVLAAPNFGQEQHVIFVTRGVYREYVNVYAHKWNLVMIGEGMHLTVVSGNRSFADGWKTFHSATFDGQGFIAMNLGFENTAGPRKHQAVALRSSTDRSAFLLSKISSYQDTLSPQQPPIPKEMRDYRHDGLHLWLQQGRLPELPNFGKKKRRWKEECHHRQQTKLHSRHLWLLLPILHVLAHRDLALSMRKSPTYLGRPWRMFSRTIFMQTYMSNVVAPEGWLQWNGSFGLGTLFYAEYSNRGAGSVLGGRVKWSGFHVLAKSSMASEFTMAEFIQGNLRLPSTGIP